MQTNSPPTDHQPTNTNHATQPNATPEVDPTPEGFTSPAQLDVSGAIAKMVNHTIREHDATVQIFGGEIGPHNDGSPVCDHTSMRWANFGTSLWYSDALAAKALHGYSGFCRQDYIGGDYGMLDCSTGAPLPDYYTALAFTTLMGQRVLGARVAELGVAGAGGFRITAADRA